MDRPVANRHPKHTQWPKRAAYYSGALPLWNRVINHSTFTVVMFHRVLPEHDPRWSYCDIEYTTSTQAFNGCLEFFKAHYNVVGIPDLLAHGRRLPPRALLVTLDDGWSDNEEFALPILQRAGVPAVVFVALDALDAPIPQPFWQMRLIHAFRRGHLTPAVCRTLWADAAPGKDAPAFTALRDCDALVSAIERLDLASMVQVIGRVEHNLGEHPADGHMMTTAQMQRLAAAGIDIGCHGTSHHPMTKVDDLDRELSDARSALGAKLGAPPATMSFPHGAYDRRIAETALRSGFDYVFTSNAVVNSMRAGVPRSRILGRIGIFHSHICDGHGEFRPELLALRLFRRKADALNGEPPTAGG